MKQFMYRPSTKIVTHLRYEDVFNNVEKGNLILPLSYLDDEKNIDALINDIIKDFDPVEAISYSSFLNMICQTTLSDNMLELNRNELRHTNLTQNPPNNKILFHRDNLLYFISQIIEQNADGKTNITGKGNIQNSQKYYKVLLFINNKLNKEASNNKNFNFMKMLIREYPYYYSPQLLYSIYSKRIERYKYVYNELLNSLPNQSKEKISEGIEHIEKQIGISLRDYFYVLEGLFKWFLEISIAKRTSQDEEFKNSNLGFDYRNLETFYIEKANFEGDEEFIKLINGLSKDLPDLRNYFKNTNRQDKVNNFYKNFQNFFDHPVFKLNENRFCIIDLKFLLEGICSGFIWKIPAERKEIEDAYGLLMEEYFASLIRDIFPHINIT